MGFRRMYLPRSLILLQPFLLRLFMLSSVRNLLVRDDDHNSVRTRRPRFQDILADLSARFGADTFVKKRDAPTIFTATDATVVPTEAAPPMRIELSDASSSSSNGTQPTLFKRFPATTTAAPPAGSAGLSCGTVISTGFTTITATTTSTLTSNITSTSTSTTYTTVPSSTSTVTSVIVTNATSIFGTTTTTIITIPATITTATVTTTSFTTAPVTTSVVSKPAGVYRKAVENTSSNHCTYGRYFSRTGASIE
ncbi:MAG: hypothetical protein Q9227_007727 [Pyrenula ochraceoflavens]